MSFQSLIQALKGGPGSGNFGHSGRPGKRGGSAPGGGNLATNLHKIVQEAHAYSASHKAEKLFVLDANGKRLWDSGDSGGAHEVEDIVLPNGATHLVHNHPSSVDFLTDGDLITLINNPELKSSTIVTRSNMVHTMTKKPTTPPVNVESLPGIIRTVWDEEAAKLEGKWLNDELSDREFKYQTSINYMKRMADILNLEYSNKPL